MTWGSGFHRTDIGHDREREKITEKVLGKHGDDLAARHHGMTLGRFRNILKRELLKDSDCPKGIGCCIAFLDARGNVSLGFFPGVSEHESRIYSQHP